jgi:hypothetical protein
MAKVERQFNRVRVVFSINGVETTGHPFVKITKENKILDLTCIVSTQKRSYL